MRSQIHKSFKYFQVTLENSKKFQFSLCLVTIILKIPSALHFNEIADHTLCAKILENIWCFEIIINQS